MAHVKQRLIDLIVDGVNRAEEVSTFEIISGAADGAFASFAASRRGQGRAYRARMIIAQDHSSGTLWDLIWTGAGTEISGVYAPHGNAVATEDKPHYSFTAIVSEPDGVLMGGEANVSAAAVPTIEVNWEVVTKPTKVIAGP